MKVYPKVVQEIHKSFFTAGDVLLAEAETVLSKAIDEKALRLKKLGFTKAIGVPEIEEQVKEREIKEVQAKLIQQYKMRYPNQKFITEDMVAKINKKYNLVCATIDRYKGFVPEEKLKAIENFAVQSKDKSEKMLTNFKFSYTSSDSRSIKLLESLNITSVPMSALVTNHLDLNQIVGSKNLHKVSSQYLRLDSYDIIDKTSLEICAPAKDMDLTGLTQTKEGFFAKLTRVECPDPVVLQPVKGGYLIIAAWGDEASDELVVNHAMN